MIVEIRKAGFVNKGAELMLHAAVQKVRERYPEAKITMAPIFGGNSEVVFEKMRELDLYPKAWFWRKGIDFGWFASFIPKKLRKIYGLVLTEDVDVVLDAAGFSYSDQRGALNSRELAASSSKWRKSGAKVILMPQAFGPFQKKDMKRYVRRWAENADLIFAREPDSYRYLTDVVGEQSKIKLYPDFTNLVKGTLPTGYDSTDKRIAIVPNYRMVDMTSSDEGKAYLPFLIHCARYMLDKGAKPFLLVHEGKNDQMLAKQVSEAVGGIPVVQEGNPRHIKGILGTCDATIGSRFHGLVSALSQGVPSLATGWSHKYSRLFEDYGFDEGLVSVLEAESELDKKLDLILDTDSSQLLRAKLSERSSVLKQRSEEMWKLVFDVIDESTPIGK